MAWLALVSTSTSEGPLHSADALRWRGSVRVKALLMVQMACGLLPIASPDLAMLAVHTAVI